LPRAYAALDHDAVPVLLRPARQTVLEEIAALETQAEAVRTELIRLAAQMPDVQLLLTIPGVGILTRYRPRRLRRRHPPLPLRA